MPGSEPPSAVAGLLAGAAAAIELTSTFVGSSQARQRAGCPTTPVLLPRRCLTSSFPIRTPQA
ncbi:hypothetical protein [Acrocarpospora pleiomorpha]|uniref:hypothetical protein n=1 Tax=Acrocarpospora pleiomorpha TaxID=90975 RepID=UPI0012D2A7B3|nr:hypothetical protein [Acrocarpospora pleiomorpha]